MENALRPCGELVSPFSSITCKAKAVDDRARPKPAMIAWLGLSKRKLASMVSTSPQLTTWKVPIPKMSKRIDHNRDGLSSSPMMNNSITTPSSAKCRISSASLMKPVTGPITMPAAR